MDTEAPKSLKLELIHGPRKFHIVLTLSPDQAGDALCVKHINEEVYKLTQIPTESQKLIFKGRSLKDPNEELAEAGLRNGSKVMLIGKRPLPADDESIKALKEVEGIITKQEKKLGDITYELDGIHRGYLEDDIKVDAVKSLEKQMKGLTETFMKLLERMDALRFEEENKEARAKRKSLVDRIQVFLSRLDGLSRGGTLTNDVVSFEQPGPETKIADFANSIDPDELAHNKLPQTTDMLEKFEAAKR